MSVVTDAELFIGRVIKSAKIDDNALILTFQDGVAIKIFDEGQQCCESRYLTTDDDVSTLAGRPLTRIEKKPGPETGDEYSVHEMCFVEVSTDVGFVTLTNHNEHNGYYGGFGVAVAAL